MNDEIQKCISTAQALLEERRKIHQKIAELEDSAERLNADLETARVELSTEEASALLGKPSSVTQGRKVLKSAMEALDQNQLQLRGLEQTLLENSRELSDSHAASRRLRLSNASSALKNVIDEYNSAASALAEVSQRLHVLAELAESSSCLARLRENQALRVDGGNKVNMLQLYDSAGVNRTPRWKSNPAAVSLRAGFEPLVRMEDATRDVANGYKRSSEAVVKVAPAFVGSIQIESPEAFRERLAAVEKAEHVQRYPVSFKAMMPPPMIISEPPDAA